MLSINYSINIKIKWVIKGYEEYGFGEDKNLYNLKTGRKIKHTVVNYSKGFCIRGKFMTDNKIKQLLEIKNNYYVPF